MNMIGIENFDSKISVQALYDMKWVVADFTAEDLVLPTANAEAVGLINGIIGAALEETRWKGWKAETACKKAKRYLDGLRIHETDPDFEGIDFASPDLTERVVGIVRAAYDFI